MTIVERKERIIEVSRLIISKELEITTLKDELEDLLTFTDKRKIRGRRPTAVIIDEVEPSEPFVPELPTEPSGL